MSSEVTDILRGSDGRAGCVYEVLYEGEQEPHEVDHLVEDLKIGHVKILR
jgi:hypothetical protein